MENKQIKEKMPPSPRSLANSSTGCKKERMTNDPTNVKPGCSKYVNKSQTSTTGAPKRKAISNNPVPVKRARLDNVHKGGAVDLLEKIKKMRESLSSLKHKSQTLKESEARLAAAREELKEKKASLNAMQENLVTMEHQKHSTEIFEIPQKNDEIKSLKTDILEQQSQASSLISQNSKLVDTSTLCKKQLDEANMKVEKLQNVLMDLRRNIKLFCRVRPTLENEKDHPLWDWDNLLRTALETHNPEVQASSVFDRVFDSTCTQKCVFESISPMIESALDGCNICIFAYGQSNSGKNFTLEGPTSNAGLIHRIIEHLNKEKQNRKNWGWEFLITVTLKKLAEDGATVGNDNSSRSHSVTQIEIIGTHDATNEKLVGSVNLVELAGSENLNTSKLMNETKYFNQSLSELFNVILALLNELDPNSNRNSNLQSLLMPCLGKNSKTLMFINVAPCQDCFVESVNSLRFAATVYSCKMAK